MKAVSQWSSIRSAASFADKADDERMRAVARASSLSEVTLGVYTSRESHRFGDRRSALCVCRVVPRASPSNHARDSAIRRDSIEA